MRAHSTVLAVIAALIFLTGTAVAQRRGAGIQTSFASEKPIRRPVKLTAAMLRQIALAVPDLARECDGDIAGNVSASRIRLNADGPPGLLLQGTFLHDGRAHLGLLAPDPHRRRLPAGIQPL